MIAEHAPRKTIIIGGRPAMEGWTAANHAAEVRSGAARQTAQRLGWAHDRHHLFRRKTSSVFARNRPASPFAAQNGF